MKRRDSTNAATATVEELSHLALELDLTALPQALPDLLRQAEQEGLSYSDFGHALLRIERDATHPSIRSASAKTSGAGIGCRLPAWYSA